MEVSIPASKLDKFIKYLQNKREKVVLAGGCFDVLHPGHVIFLQKAKKEGDILVVLLESDEKVKRLKGDGRPIHTQEKRAENLSALKVVDFVVLLPFMKENSEDGNNVRVCKSIFNQLIEASRQRTHMGQELLISTILEAALRTIGRHPFKEGDKSWGLRKSMIKFRNNYLSDKWIIPCDKAIRAHIYLRNRNAHPDWLISPGGSLSEEELSKSLDDMIFLSRFYGYMILALAGYKNLEPEFTIDNYRCNCLN